MRAGRSLAMHAQELAAGVTAPCCACGVCARSHADSDCGRVCSCLLQLQMTLVCLHTRAVPSVTPQSSSGQRPIRRLSRRLGCRMGQCLA